jgi:hypothetical protein
LTGISPQRMNRPTLLTFNSCLPKIKKTSHY